MPEIKLQKRYKYAGDIMPKLLDIGFDLETASDFLNSIPDADVVPKSEVDELIGKFECFLCHVTGSRLSKHTYDLGTMESVATDCINETYNDGYGEGYKDCAREIFTDIEECRKIERLKTPLICISMGALAELKKKYTEGEK